MDKNKKKVVACVDATIEAVSNRIQNDAIAHEHYSDTVKALAQLVEARARLCKVNKRAKASKEKKILIDWKAVSEALRNAKINRKEIGEINERINLEN